jgi:hypothetical protein
MAGVATPNPTAGRSIYNRFSEANNERAQKIQEAIMAGKRLG